MQEDEQWGRPLRGPFWNPGPGRLPGTVERTGDRDFRQRWQVVGRDGGGDQQADGDRAGPEAETDHFFFSVLVFLIVPHMWPSVLPCDQVPA